MKALVFVAVAIISASNLVLAEEWLGDWLEKNEPKVINYLKSLTSAKVGEKVAGITLSDGKKELEGFTYVGKVKGTPKETYIYLFRNPDYVVAYTWVEKGGDPLRLPPCDENDPRSKWPGWDGAVLSGDVYTYPDVHPGYGLVTTHCVSDAWLKNAGP